MQQTAGRVENKISQALFRAQHTLLSAVLVKLAGDKIGKYNKERGIVNIYVGVVNAYKAHKPSVGSQRHGNKLFNALRLQKMLFLRCVAFAKLRGCQFNNVVALKRIKPKADLLDRLVVQL